MLFPYQCNISVWNWSITMNIYSALWVLMPWCFSTRASVATVLNMHPCFCSCLWVNTIAQGWGNAEKLHQLTMSLTHGILIYGKCQGLLLPQHDHLPYLCFQSTFLWWFRTSTTIPTQQYETSLEADSKYIPRKLPTVLALFLTEKTLWNVVFTLWLLMEILADLKLFLMCSSSDYL